MSLESDKAVFTKFDASAYRVGIVVAGFNKSITDGMLAEAKKCLAEYGVSETNTTVVSVAGAVEVPVVLQALAEKKSYDCLIAISAIIRGDTPHFDYVAKIVAEGVLRVQLDHTMPIGFGVLTVENQQQAEVRLHVGYGAAEAALQSRKAIKALQ